MSENAETQPKPQCDRVHMMQIAFTLCGLTLLVKGSRRLNDLPMTVFGGTIVALSLFTKHDIDSKRMSRRDFFLKSATIAAAIGAANVFGGDSLPEESTHKPPKSPGSTPIFRPDL